MSTAWDIVVKVLLALACGGAIGLERERKDRPAGFRTHMLVAMGACLFTALSVAAFGGDKARVAAQVVTGIGFIGAGVIIIHTGGVVVGLTTAATLWSSAAIGMALGVGYFKVGLIVTGIVLMVLEVFDHIGGLLVKRIMRKSVILKFAGSYTPELLEEAQKVLTSHNCHPDILGLNRYAAGNRFEYVFSVRVGLGADLSDLSAALMRIRGVEEVGWQE